MFGGLSVTTRRDRIVIGLKTNSRKPTTGLEEKKML
jgi:hypothetical protein